MNEGNKRLSKENLGKITLDILDIIWCKIYCVEYATQKGIDSVSAGTGEERIQDRIHGVCSVSSASNSSRNSLRSEDRFVPRRLAESQGTELYALSVRKVSGTASGTKAVDIPNKRRMAHGNSQK